jgi:hypothetical protein
MTDTPQLLLAHHLKVLKLPTFLREYDKLARQCAAEGVDHVRYLLRLAELELIERERRLVERPIKDAKFPAVKSLDSFDFLAPMSLNEALVRPKNGSSIQWQVGGGERLCPSTSRGVDDLASEVAGYLAQAMLPAVDELNRR